MRDYGKVHTSFWTSSDMRELSEDGRVLAIYLLTCPHGTIAGVFRLPDGYVCDDIQWSTERVNRTLVELLNKGFATRCERTKWVWVTKHLEWNPPENPNQIKAAAKMAVQVPDACSWKIDFIQKYGEFLNIGAPASEPLSNPSETLVEPVTVTVTVAGTEAGKKDSAAEATPISPKQKREEVTLAQYLETCKAAEVKAVPDDHFIRAWCDDAKITNEMLQVAWVVFREHYTTDEKLKRKRYKDWPGTFANAVKDRWHKLWFAGPDGVPAWTPNGLQHKQVLEARQKQGGVA